LYIPVPHYFENGRVELQKTKVLSLPPVPWSDEFGSSVVGPIK